MAKEKPELENLLPDVTDNVMKELLTRLVEYFRNQNQLQDFKHIEFETDAAVTNLKISHGLGFVPKDIVRTKLVGVGSLTFNHDQFDTSFLDVTTTGAVRFRGFVGTYIGDTSTIADTLGETL